MVCFVQNSMIYLIASLRMMSVCLHNPHADVLQARSVSCQTGGGTLRPLMTQSHSNGQTR